MAQTLRDWLPGEALGGEYTRDAFRKHLDVEIVEEMKGYLPRQSWPGRHKNVLHWVKLANGRAVGGMRTPLSAGPSLL